MLFPWHHVYFLQHSPNSSFSWYDTEEGMDGEGGQIEKVMIMGLGLQLNMFSMRLVAVAS